MKNKKFYVIWIGYMEGVFNDWNMCKQYVIGYPGALYKSFKSYEEADKAYEMGYEEYMRQCGKKTPSSL